MLRKVRLTVLFLVLASTFAVASVRSVGAAAEADEAVSIPDVLTQVLQNHHASTINDLDCDKIAPDEWEAIGEAVMSQMHPVPAQHEAMDEMMGGEGSESLRRAHVRMGQNYLGCRSYGSGLTPMMGMMGGSNSSNRERDGGLIGMMGGNFDGEGHLGWMGLNYPVFTGLALILGTLTWTALIIALLAVARYFWRKTP
jgi:hypothetical protein